jgi:hypothetical protein
MGRYQSGQLGQTVNLLAYAFGGSNPPLPTNVLSVSMMISNTALIFVMNCFTYFELNLRGEGNRQMEQLKNL